MTYTIYYLTSENKLKLKYASLLNTIDSKISSSRVHK